MGTSDHLDWFTKLDGADNPIAGRSDVDSDQLVFERMK